jgi:hypothetical protein
MLVPTFSEPAGELLLIVEDKSVIKLGTGIFYTPGETMEIWLHNFLHTLGISPQYLGWIIAMCLLVAFRNWRSK